MAEAKLKQLGVGRRHADDPLFVSGDACCRLFVREGIIDIDDEQLCHQVVPLFPCDAPNCQETFASLLEFEMHYNSRHRFICAECRKPVPTAHLLDLHISESHDSFFAAQAQRKPMYRCFVEECPVLSQDVSQRRRHCIEVHSFPHDFRYDQSTKKIKNPNHKKPNKWNVPSKCESMAVDEEVGEKKPNIAREFTFGHVKSGKSFNKTKPWHSQGKKNRVNKESTSGNSKSDIDAVEVMESLPS